MQTDLPRKGDSAYLQLLERIKTGYWKIGEVIPGELKLATDFNCSRGTIGKALTRLAHEGFVQRKMRTGTQVVRNSASSTERKINLDALAFIYPSLKEDGIWATVTGFRNAALEGGHRTVLLTTGTDYRKELELIAGLNELNIRGAVFYLVVETPEEQAQVSQALLRAAFPVVLACANLPGMNLPAAFFHGFHAGYVLTKHVIARGARRIGFYSSGRPSEESYGYQWALREAGLPLDERLLVPEQRSRADFQGPRREPSEEAEAYLRARPELEAVVCSDDPRAVAIIEAAQRLGRRVPEDLRVTGRDDSAKRSPVPLTTYRVPYEQVGAQTFSLLMQRIESGTSPLECRVTGELVVRESA